ncbi:hypothetical protein KJ885_02630 [Patescibacteria group bacterium]|nr:hypothetical protein [Patescibacteria group bacterium]
MGKSNDVLLREKLAEVIRIMNMHGTRSEEVRNYCHRVKDELGDQWNEFLRLVAVLALEKEGKI